MCPRTSKDSRAFANALTLCTAIFVAWPTAVQQTRRWRQPTVTFGAIDISAALPDRPRPDIYILILDAYGRADVLRDYYHFENTLVPELEKLGFTIPPKAASNYAQTALSLASSLNLEYLPTLLEKQVSVGEPRARLADLISRNRVFETFTTAGYRIRSYSSEYGLLQPQIVDERPHPTLFMNDFEYGFYEATALPMLFAMAGRPVGTIPFALHRHHIRWTLDHLRRDLPATNDPPTLVFAHLLIPHPPFSFEPDGSPLESRLPANFNDGSHWRAQAEGRGETYEAGYTKAIQFVNNAVVDIVRNVVNRPDGRQTIFYIEETMDRVPGSTGRIPAKPTPGNASQF